jgi:hypothetical protein
MSARFGFQFVDLHPLFLNDEGELRDEYALDAVHLNVSGYMAWLGAISDGDDVETLINLAPLWLLANSPERLVHKVDPPFEGEYPGSRGRHEMVIYTPAYERESTGTNEWGQEAIVEDGVVVELNLHDSPIPSNGFVVSGHLTAAHWITTNLHPGVRVEHDESEIRILPPPAEEMTPAERTRLLRIRALQLILRNESETVQTRGRDLLREILALEQGDEEPGAEELDAITAQLEMLSSEQQ